MCCEDTYHTVQGLLGLPDVNVLPFSPASFFFVSLTYYSKDVCDLTLRPQMANVPHSIRHTVIAIRGQRERTYVYGVVCVAKAMLSIQYYLL